MRILVIGIHEDASDFFIPGEDQEILPLNNIEDIIENHTELSINESLYRDIRSYQEETTIWNLSLESFQSISSQDPLELLELM